MFFTPGLQHHLPMANPSELQLLLVSLLVKGMAVMQCTSEPSLMSVCLGTRTSLAFPLRGGRVEAEKLHSRFCVHGRWCREYSKALKNFVVDTSPCPSLCNPRTERWKAFNLPQRETTPSMCSRSQKKRGVSSPPSRNNGRGKWTMMSGHTR